MKKYNYNIIQIGSNNRLDLSLKDFFKGYSRNYIISLIKLGKVKVNKETIYLPSHKVKYKDFIEIIIEKTMENKTKDSFLLNIVYEDKHLIIINKQAGLLTHRSKDNQDFSLVDLLVENKIDLYKGNDNLRVGVVHRLDKDTSGLIIFAKSHFASIELKKQFFSRTIKKIYEAVVWGKAQPASGTVNLPITSYLNRKKVTLNNEGKEALTEYKVKKSFSNYFSLIECRIHTGRTHQIRVHMRSLGCPVVGDKLYANDRNISKEIPENKSKAVILFKRQALHAKEISFFHPVIKKQFTFKMKMPEDMQSLARTLFD